MNKVPLLGDIPFLGNAFKRTTKTDTKTELLIFLTPYIVEGTDKLDELTVDQVNRTDIPQQAFPTQKDVSQYLDSTLSLMPGPVRQPLATPAPADKRTVTTRKTHDPEDDHDREAGGSVRRTVMFTANLRRQGRQKPTASARGVIARAPGGRRRILFSQSPGRGGRNDRRGFLDRH